MTSDTDHTLPGKAGLFFTCEALNEAGWHQEHEARARLERWCHACGQSACYGYGVTLKDDGVWSCSDASCRSQAEGEAMDAAWAQRITRAPLAKPLNPASDRAPDLFGEAA